VLFIKVLQQQSRPFPLAKNIKSNNYMGKMFVNAGSMILHSGIEPFNTVYFLTAKQSQTIIFLSIFHYDPLVGVVMELSKSVGVAPVTPGKDWNRYY
jgi:hypothetical protein